MKNLLFSIAFLMPVLNVSAAEHHPVGGVPEQLPECAAVFQQALESDSSEFTLHNSLVGAASSTQLPAQTWQISLDSGTEYVWKYKENHNNTDTINLTVEGEVITTLAENDFLVHVGNELGRWSNFCAFDATGQSLELIARVDQGELLVQVDVAKATFPVYIDPLFSHVRQRFEANFVGAPPANGSVIDQEGDWLAIVAADEGFQSGNIRLFYRENGLWKFQHMISGVGDGRAKGIYVAMSEKVAVIGGEFHDQTETVKVFSLENAFQQVTLAPLSAYREVGEIVAAYGDYLVTARTDGEGGMIYVDDDDFGWKPENVVRPSEVVAAEIYNTVVAYVTKSESGARTLTLHDQLTRNPEILTSFSCELHERVCDDNYLFGESIALSSNKLIVGVPPAVRGAPHAGEILIFYVALNRESNEFELALQQTLVAEPLDEPDRGDYIFGQKIAFEPKLGFIGTGTFNDAAFFREVGQEWERIDIDWPVRSTPGMLWSADYTDVHIDGFDFFTSCSFTEGDESIHVCAFESSADISLAIESDFSPESGCLATSEGVVCDLVAGQSVDIPITVSNLDAHVSVQDLAIEYEGSSALLPDSINGCDVNDVPMACEFIETVMPESNALVEYSFTASELGETILQFESTSTMLDPVEANNVLTVTFNVVNQKPVVSDLVSTAIQSNVLDLKFAGDDADDHDIEFQFTSSLDSALGRITNFDSEEGSFRYTPFVSCGLDTYQFVAYDGFEFSDEATLEINITNEYRGELEELIWVQRSAENIPHQGQLSELFDADDATFALGDVTPIYGEVVVTSDGQFTYTPTDDADSLAVDDQLSVIIYDACGSRANEQELLVTIKADIPPQALSGELLTGVDTPVTGVLTARDDARDLSLFRFEIVDQPTKGTVNITSARPGVDVNGNVFTTYQYTPFSGQQGTDNFSFRVSDGSYILPSATAFVTVNIDSEVLSFSTDSIMVEMLEDNIATLNLAQEFGVDDPSAYQVSLLTSPKKGRLTAGVSLMENVAYQANENEFGDDQFTIQISQGTKASLPLTVNIEITPVNDAPILKDATITLELNDDLLGQPLSAQLNSVTDAENDAVTLSWLNTTEQGEISNLDANGRFTFTTDNAEDAVIELQFQGKDSEGATSATHRLTLIIDYNERADLGGGNSGEDDTGNDDDKDSGGSIPLAIIALLLMSLFIRKRK